MIQATIPARTMDIMCIIFNDLVNIEGIDLEDIKRGNFYPVPQNKNSNLKPKDIQALQDIIVCRDNARNGMSRDEAIIMVSQLSHIFNHSKCQQQWNYLIANNKTPNFKAGGKVEKAQNKTNKRTNIHVEQQPRFHTTIGPTF